MSNVEKTRDPRFAELDAAIKGENQNRPRTSPLVQSPRTQPGTQDRRKGLEQGKEFARRFAEIVRRELGQQLNRAESIQVAQEFRSAVVPRKKPGRKPSLHVTRAYAAYQTGKRGVALYRDFISGYEKLGRLARKERAAKLMASIRTRRRRDPERRAADQQLPAPAGSPSNDLPTEQFPIP